MVRELNYMIINYSNNDLEYIDYICNELDKKSQEIVDFFDIKDFGKKVSVTLFDSLELFRSECAKVNRTLVSNVPEWVCGMKIPNGDIYTLCLEEYRKTKGHENKCIEDLVYLILHEFTHACHGKVKKDNQRGYAWLVEGLATTISHQYDNSLLVFNASLDEMIKGTKDYKNYHTMFKYVLDTYGRNYVLELIKNYDLLVKDTPRLYEEVRELYYDSELGKKGKKR